MSEIYCNCPTGKCTGEYPASRCAFRNVPQRTETGKIEVPVEVLDLLRFMCETWVKIDEFVYPNCLNTNKYPVIQGTANQIRLSRIAEQPYNAKDLCKAMDWMLEQKTG